MNKRCDLVLPAEHRELQSVWANIQRALSHRKEVKAQNPWWGWLRMSLPTIISNNPHKTFLHSTSVILQFSSVQSFSCVWLFATSWTAALQASLSITNSGVYSNSCPLSWWCHPAISSSVIPFSSCPQSLPASESFPMTQFFTTGGKSIGISASA